MKKQCTIEAPTSHAQITKKDIKRSQTGSHNLEKIINKSMRTKNELWNTKWRIFWPRYGYPKPSILARLMQSNLQKYIKALQSREQCKVERSASPSPTRLGRLQPGADLSCLRQYSHPGPGTNWVPTVEVLDQLICGSLTRLVARVINVRLKIQAKWNRKQSKWRESDRK